MTPKSSETCWTRLNESYVVLVNAGDGMSFSVASKNGFDACVTFRRALYEVSVPTNPPSKLRLNVPRVLPSTSTKVQVVAPDGGRTTVAVAAPEGTPTKFPTRIT